MKKALNFVFNDIFTTGSANYNTTTSTAPSGENGFRVINNDEHINNINEIGKYSVFDVADWFLMKEDMTQKKLQKLCYYAQAWCYALKNYRLVDADFQAWIHGPVSPVLYEKFKSFGYDAISISKKAKSVIAEEDIDLLEDVWKTYGDRTGNALEALTHRELPWIEARKGYAGNERCVVVIDPETMKRYYKIIRLDPTHKIHR